VLDVSESRFCRLLATDSTGSDTRTGDISEPHSLPSWSGSGTRFAQPRNDLYCYTIPECKVEAPDDGWLWHPKHVEQRTKENQNKIELLHLVGILFIKNFNLYYVTQENIFEAVSWSMLNRSKCDIGVTCLDVWMFCTRCQKICGKHNLFINSFHHTPILWMPYVKFISSSSKCHTSPK
jgi:hypothetical protein